MRNLGAGLPLGGQSLPDIVDCGQFTFRAPRASDNLFTLIATSGSWRRGSISLRFNFLSARECYCTRIYGGSSESRILNL